MASPLDAAAAAGATTLAYSVSAGSNRCLMVGVTQEGTTVGAPTCTYGGETMVNVVDVEINPGSTSQRVTLFFLDDAGITAASGTTITPANVNTASMGIHARSYQDASQSTPTNTDSDSSTASTPNPLANCDIVTGAADAVVVALSGMGNNGTAAWGGTLTERTEQDTTGTATGSLADDEVPSATTIACDCTWTTQNRAVIVACELENAGATLITLAATVTGVATLLAPGISLVTPSEFDFDNTDVDIIGGNFEASQGSGTVYLSDASTLAGSANEVEISGAINTWSGDLVNLDFSGLSAAEVSNLHTLGPGARFIILVNDSSDEYSSAVTLHRPQAFQMVLGAATPGSTTARLTGMTGTFAGGRIEETAAQNPSTTNTDVASAGNREDVWVKEAKPNSRAVQYDFRVLYGGEVADTITQTPQVTIESGADETLAATVTGLATLTRVGQFYRTLAATVTGTASIPPGDWTLTAQPAASAGLVDRWAHRGSNATQSATATATAALIRFVQIIRTLAATATGVATVAFQRIFSNILLAATATGSATLARLALLFRTLVAATTGLATFIVEELGGGITEITLAAVATANAVLLKVATFFRSFAATVTGVGTLLRRWRAVRVLSATATGSATLLKFTAYFRTFSASAMGAATLLRRWLTSRTLSAAATGTASLLKNFSTIILSAATTGVATIIEQLIGGVATRTLAATATATASLSRIATFFRALTTSATASASIPPGDWTLTAEDTANASMEDRYTHFNLRSAVATGSATLIKFQEAITRLLAATATGAATLNIRISVLLSAAMTGLATLALGVTEILLAVASEALVLMKTRYRHFNVVSAAMTAVAVLVENFLGIASRTLTATATGVATLAKQPFFSRLLSATITAAATLNRLVTAFRTLAATVTGVATLLRDAAVNLVTLAATVTGIATLIRLSIFRRILSATVTGVATMPGFLRAITLTATATGVATLIALYQQFVEPFTGHGGMGLPHDKDRWAHRVGRWAHRNKDWKRRK